eukprot:COSAG05_NODE_460_length_9597_cov_8.288798_6_plen_227_part_00
MAFGRRSAGADVYILHDSELRSLCVATLPVAAFSYFCVLLLLRANLPVMRWPTPHGVTLADFPLDYCTVASSGAARWLDSCPWANLKSLAFPLLLIRLLPITCANWKSGRLLISRLALLVLFVLCLPCIALGVRVASSTVTCSIITTVRKVLQIAVSAAAFGHRFSVLQQMGLVVRTPQHRRDPQLKKRSSFLSTSSRCFLWNASVCMSQLNRLILGGGVTPVGAR